MNFSWVFDRASAEHQTLTQGMLLPLPVHVLVQLLDATNTPERNHDVEPHHAEGSASAALYSMTVEAGVPERIHLLQS